MNSYELSRRWFDFCFENPEKIKPIHSAIYFFAIEHCNRLGWKEKFGFPSGMAMEAIGIKKYQTYGSAINDLYEWGFIEFIERSKNQYSANIITLFATPKKGKAQGKALDKALIKHGSKQGQSTDQSTVQGMDTINKQYNKEQRTKNNSTDSADLLKSNYQLFTELWFNFCEERTGVRPKFDGVQGAKMKSIVKYLEGICEDKKSNPVEAFETILKNWNSMDEWMQSSCLDLKVFEQKISIAINQIKNGRKKQNTAERIVSAAINDEIFDKI